MLTFTYAVKPGDSSADLEATGPDALGVTGATIRDAAGNDTMHTLPAPAVPAPVGPMPMR